MRYETTPYGPFDYDGPTLVDPYAGLLIWGMSGWDTRAAANWFAQYRPCFRMLMTNATEYNTGKGVNKWGVTTVILSTDHIADCCGDLGDEFFYEYLLEGVKEILGPPAGRWRLSETAWNVWISAPLSIEW